MDVRVLATLLATLLAPLALAGCSGSDDQSPASGSSQEPTVEMVNVEFRPETLTVAAGTEVRWVNRDPMGHTVTPEDPDQWGTAGSGDDASQWLQKGDTWSHRFDEPGTYYYYCMPHASMPTGGGHAQGMVGKVIVQ